MTDLLRELGSTAPDTPSLSVAVPVLDGGERLVTLARAVRAQASGFPGGVELLLADSGSIDGAFDRAADAFGPGARRFQVARGRYDHGRVRSALVLAARAPLVALFSQDAVPLDGALAALSEPFAAHPDLAGVMARQVPRPGADPLVRATLQRWTPEGGEAVLRRLPPGAASLPPTERMRLARFDNVGSMVRRASIEELPFPSRPFGEDLAWGAAALERGWALGYAPAARVEHHHDPTLGELYARNRVAHRQAAAEFGLRAVPSLRHGLAALLTGVPQDLRDGGPRWLLPGLARRGAALLGQLRGGADGGGA